MSRLSPWAMGGASLMAAAWLVAGPGLVRGADERRVEVRVGSGSMLGVTLRDVESADVSRLKLPEERGAMVKSVEPDSPAQKAGLQPDDVILRYQGEAIHSVAQLARLVRETPPGRKVSIEVSRHGAPQKLTATLAEGKGPRLLSDLGDIDVRVPPMPSLERLLERDESRDRGRRLMFRDRLFDLRPRKLGIEYQEVSDQLARYFKLEGDRGLLVSHVDENGPAGQAGMKAGDVILTFNDKTVRDSEDLREELDRTQAGQEVAVKVQREGKPVELKVRLGGRETRKQQDRTT